MGDGAYIGVAEADGSITAAYLMSGGGITEAGATLIIDYYKAVPARFAVALGRIKKLANIPSDCEWNSEYDSESFASGAEFVRRAEVQGVPAYLRSSDDCWYVAFGLSASTSVPEWMRLGRAVAQGMGMPDSLSPNYPAEYSVKHHPNLRHPVSMEIL